MFLRYLLALSGIISCAYTLSSSILIHSEILTYRTAFIIQFFVTLYMGILSFIAENTEILYGSKFMLTATLISAFLTGIYMICAIGETRR